MELDEAKNPVKIRRPLGKVLKVTVCIILICFFLLYIAYPVGIGAFASRKFSEPVSNPPQGFTQMTLTTSDNVKLAAWYKPPGNGMAIILIHGATSSRESIRSYSKMLAGSNYGVLAFDMRGHGESGGGGNAYNWNGTLDVGAAVDFLKKQDGVKAIGGLGLSLGGEVLLGAASAYPEIKAIVSDGATYRSVDDYLIFPSERNLIRSWTTRLMYSSVGFFTGDTPPVRIVDSIEKAGGTRLLLIAAGNVGKEERYNSRFLKTANGRSELWVVPGAGHTGAYSRYPEEYGRRVLKFFESAL